MVKFRQYIVELLSMQDDKVIFGRFNYEYDNHNEPIIIVDAINSKVLGVGEDFSDTDESMSYNSTIMHTAIVDFFGLNANKRAYDFINLVRSEKSMQLQRQLSLCVYHPSNPVDLRFLADKEYNERYQVQVAVADIHTTVLDTLRIDEAVFDTVFINK